MKSSRDQQSDYSSSSGDHERLNHAANLTKNREKRLKRVFTGVQVDEESCSSACVHSSKFLIHCPEFDPVCEPVVQFVPEKRLLMCLVLNVKEMFRWAKLRRTLMIQEHLEENGEKDQIYPQSKKMLLEEDREMKYI